MGSTAHRLKDHLEERGEYVVKANTRWFAVFLATWRDRSERARRDGREGPNLVVYKTRSDDPRDHYVIPHSVIRELLVNDTMTTSEVNGSQRWNLTLENGKLHVSHRSRKEDVSATYGARLLLEETESSRDLTESPTESKKDEGTELRRFIPAEHWSAVLGVIASSADIAHRAAPDAWGIRVKDRSVMLKVGPHEVLQVGPWRRPCHLLVDGALVPQALRANLNLWFSLDRDYEGNLGKSGYYASNPGTEACKFDFPELVEVYRALAAAHVTVIERAARMRRHSSTAGMHSAAFVAFLATETGLELQQPAYVDSFESRARVGDTRHPMTRRGTTDLRPETRYLRSGYDEREVDPIHNHLQNVFFHRLRDKYGIAVIMEEGFADIKLRLPDGSVDLFEVKSDERPRIAIRAALGQLLEYGYATTKRGQRVRSLVVAAPGALNEADAAYLAYLQRILQVELSYIQIHSDVAVDSYRR
jgi:hypothetical protein